MNDRMITFETIIGALKHQKKLFIKTLIVFSLIGVFSALLYTPKEIVPANGFADSLPEVSFEGIERNEDYFQETQGALANSLDKANSYFVFVSRNLNITNAFSERVSSLREEINILQGEVDQIREELDALWPYVLPECVVALTKEYEYELENAKIQADAAISAEKDLRFLAKEESISNNEAYLRLVEQASLLKEYEQEKLLWEKRLEILEENLSEVTKNSGVMESRMEDTRQRLNELLSKINCLANDLAKENSVICDVSYDEADSLVVNMTHTYSAVEPEEVAKILIVFCVLVGICAGAFFAICKETMCFTPDKNTM